MMPQYATVLTIVLLFAGSAFAQNSYYDHGSYPAPGSTGSSAGMRAELDLIEAGFAKLPTLSGNANKAVIVNGSATALGTTTGTLTLPGNFALSGANAVTLTTTGATNVTLPTSGTLATVESAIQKGASFPVSPSVNDLFLLTADSASGDCNAGGGTARSLCYWDGADWSPVSSNTALSDTLATITARGNTSTGNDESNPLEILGTGGQASYGWSIDRTSTGESRMRCKEAAGLNKCNYYRQLDAGFKAGYKDSGGNVDFEYDEASGKVSAITLNAEDAGVNLTFYSPICGGDMAGVDPATGTAGHVMDKSPLDTAPTATAITGTNQTYGVLRFPDSDGDFGVQFTCMLRPGFTGNVDAVAWGKTTGTGNFRLQIATVCYGTDEANDTAFNTASVYTLAAGTSGRLNRYAMSNITITGCAANELMFVRVFRNRTEASDTLNSTFDLKSVRLWARNTE